MSLQDRIECIIADLHGADGSAVQRGLVAVDTLLYQLCVRGDPNRARSRSGTFHRHSASSSSVTTNSSMGSTDELEFPPSSPTTSETTTTGGATRKWRVPTARSSTFGEFVSLQDSFEYNLAGQLMGLIRQRDRLSNEQTALVLKDLQGCLLVHPKSRKMFQREHNMRTLLELLDCRTDSTVLINCVPVLVSCLVRNVKGLRMFESLQGPETMCNLLKSGPDNDRMEEDMENTEEAWKEVQVKVLEFLFFYLIPESIKEGEKVGSDGVLRRGMESKRQILEESLNKEVTHSLVRELLESRPFGRMRTAW